MSKRPQIVWIDDNPSRERTASDIGARFINVKDKSMEEEIERLLGGSPWGLVIIDHILDKTSESTHPVFNRGSTIAEAIKVRWPSCAVVGVTNANNLEEIDIRTKGIYDELVRFDNFGKYIGRLDGIRRGFALIAGKDRDARQLIKLLKPPRNEIERLNDALPDDLKANSKDTSIASRLYRWVDRLMERPGFLLDSLWTATLLGLNKAGFDRVTAIFASASYAGVFARPDEPRWWSVRLTEILYKQCEPALGELSWHVGRQLPGTRKEHYSRCFVCKGDFPETVGFLDEASSDRRAAMHLKCTTLDPRHKRELYFEDLRVMQR